MKEVCTLIAANLRSLAELLEQLDVKPIGNAANKYTAEQAIEYLSVLATADKKAKIKDIKALINKYGFQKLPQLKTADQKTIDALMSEAEVIANATE